MNHKEDRKILLDVGDGPEGILIYTSENQGVLDWSSTEPTVYLEIANWETSYRIRFTRQYIVNALVEALAPKG